MDSEYEYIFKLVIVGDTGVGKSAILVRLIDDSYNLDEGHYVTIGIDFKIKTMNINGAAVKLQIWDTAGLERFHTITSSYYKGAHGIIVVYDCTREITFKNVPRWFSEIEKCGSSRVNKLLIGNKTDLIHNKCVTTQTGQKLADELGTPFLETSARNASNVESAFITMTEQIINRIGPFMRRAPNPNDSLRIGTSMEVTTESNYCCYF